MKFREEEQVNGQIKSQAEVKFWNLPCQMALGITQDFTAQASLAFLDLNGHGNVLCTSV